MLIIGSAAGVAAMGLERIDFIWYLKKISWLALAGYLAGAGVYWPSGTDHDMTLPLLVSAPAANRMTIKKRLSHIKGAALCFF